ncbi:MAG: aldose 1-epimerase [Thermoanaerobaculia bacterium]
MREPESPTAGGLPVVTLERPRTSGPDRPAFLSAQVLPGRGMTTLQLTAHLPGRGAADLLVSPSLEEAPAFFGRPGETFPGNASYLVGGAILLPFANRIRGSLSDDRKTIEADLPGGKVRLPANAGGRRPGAEQYAMHGLLLDARPDEIDREPDRVVATYRCGDFDHQWPSATEVVIENVLRDDSFTLNVTARNTGAEPLPMGIGWHPYFALPSGHRQQARLRLPARRRTLVNDYDEVLPTGEVVPLAGTPYDFSAPGGKPLGDLYLDDCFVDLERTAGGDVVAEVIDPEAFYGLRVIGASPHIQAIQVYGPPDKGFIVLEPQFNRADPFGARWGSGVDTGMVTVPPGGSVAYSARLELFVPPGIPA